MANTSGPARSRLARVGGRAGRHPLAADQGSNRLANRGPVFSCGVGTGNTRRAPVRQYTESPEAYDFFLQGQEYYFRQTRSSNQRAKELYRSSIQLDPTFARAYGALAITQGREAYNGWAEDPGRTLREGLGLAQRAVTLGPNLPQAHWAIAFIHLLRRDHQLALAAAEKAVAIDPSYADGYGLMAWILTFSGKPERAIELLGTAMEFDPQPGANLLGVLGQAQYWANRMDQALASTRKSVQKNPNLIDARLYLAAIYVRLRRHADAKWQAQEVLALNPEFELQRWARRYPTDDRQSLGRLLSDLREAGFE